MGLPLRRRTAARDPPPADRAVARHLARRAARRPARHSATATGSTGRGRPTRACASTRTSCCSTPTPARSAASSSPTRRSSAYAGADLRATSTRRSATSGTPRRTSRAAWWSHDDFDWTGDRPIGAAGATPSSTSCTSRASPQLHDRVPEELRGTYAGLGHPGGHRLPARPRRDGGRAAARSTSSSPSPRWLRRGLTNYWGYNSIGFFAPHEAYSSSGDRGEQVHEFKQMVRNFHDAGIEVYPRRGLQPHRRGRRGRADAVLPRARRPRLLQAGARPTPGDAGGAGHLLGRHRLRQHRRRRRTRWRCG